MLLGLLLFRVPVNEPLPDVYLVSLVFIAANLGLGLVILTLAKN